MVGFCQDEKLGSALFEGLEFTLGGLKEGDSTIMLGIWECVRAVATAAGRRPPDIEGTLGGGRLEDDGTSIGVPKGGDVDLGDDIVPENGGVMRGELKELCPKR